MQRQILRAAQGLITPENVLKAMISLNVFMYLASLLFSGRNITFSMNPFYALTPSIQALEFLGASGRYPILRFEAWWSLITATWLHGGLIHIIFNMLALKTLAPLVIQEFGISRMFTIYTLSGAAGFLLSFFGNVHLTIGASCGICGLIGAALYFGKSRGGPWGSLIYRQTTGWVMTLLLIGFLLPNINNWGHAGGFLAGVALGWILRYGDQRQEQLLDHGLALVLAGMTLWLLTCSVVKGLILIYG